MILNINTAETKKMITQIKAERLNKVKLNKGNMKHNVIFYYCELYVGWLRRFKYVYEFMVMLIR